MPPLSSEVFTEKVLANKATAAASAAKASFEKSCPACSKTYYSDNAYNNHLNSQKHKINVAKSGRSDDAASVSGSVMSSAFSLGESIAESDATTGVNGEADKDISDVVDGIKNTKLDHPARARQAQPEKSGDDSSSQTSTKPSTDPLVDCLFCNYRSPNMKLNIHHMTRFHGLFLPEKEFLVDTEGLFKYLHGKVHEGFQCLRCQKVLHSASGIQTHMRDLGHCSIAYETDEDFVEVGDFYDFRSSYPDAAEFDARQEAAENSDDSTSTAGGGVRLGAPRKTVTTTEDGEEQDEGWETDSTVSSVPTDEITAIPIDRSHRHKSLHKSRHHAHGDPRPHRNADGFHSHAHATPVAVYHDEYELHLPSGRTAGHRSLNKYYRQNLRNYPGVAERMEAANRRTITNGSSDSDAGSDADDDNDDEERNERGRNGRGRQLITRADGGLGMVGVSDAKKAEIRAVEKRDQKREQRARNKYQANVQKQHNFQKHFRDPLLQ